MFKTKNMVAALAAVLAAAPATPLVADDLGSYSRVNYGAQVSVIQPLGELSDFGTTGFGGSMYIERVWSNSWALRGRLEYLMLGEKVGEYAGNSSFKFSMKSRINQVGAMADCIYYPALADVPYFFAGVGVFSRNNTGTIEIIVDGAHKGFDWKDLDSEAVKTSFAYSFGAGWNFTRHLGVELKATTSGTITWVQGSLIYRF